MSRMRKALDGPTMYVKCVLCGKFDITDVCGDCRREFEKGPKQDPPKMSRAEALLRLAVHPFYGTQVLKVGMTILREFVEQNAGLDHTEFERATQRMFLDKADKPRFWSTIEDILVAANNMSVGK